MSKAQHENVHLLHRVDELSQELRATRLQLRVIESQIDELVVERETWREEALTARDELDEVSSKLLKAEEDVGYYDGLARREKDEVRCRDEHIAMLARFNEKIIEQRNFWVEATEACIRYMFA